MSANELQQENYQAVREEDELGLPGIGETKDELALVLTSPERKKGKGVGKDEHTMRMIEEEKETRRFVSKILEREKEAIKETGDDWRKPRTLKYSKPERKTGRDEVVKDNGETGALWVKNPFASTEILDARTFFEGLGITNRLDLLVPEIINKLFCKESCPHGYKDFTELFKKILGIQYASKTTSNFMLLAGNVGFPSLKTELSKVFKSLNINDAANFIDSYKSLLDTDIYKGLTLRKLLFLIYPRTNMLGEVEYLIRRLAEYVYGENIGDTSDFARGQGSEEKFELSEDKKVEAKEILEKKGLDSTIAVFNTSISNLRNLLKRNTFLYSVYISLNGQERGKMTKDKLGKFCKSIGYREIKDEVIDLLKENGLGSQKEIRKMRISIFAKKQFVIRDGVIIAGNKLISFVLQIPASSITPKDFNEFIEVLDLPTI